MPDSVPVISKSLKMNRIFYNCGHGHYGLTHAATSAKLLEDNDLDKAKAFSIDRFS